MAMVAVHAARTKLAAHNAILLMERSIDSSAWATVISTSALARLALVSTHPSVAAAIYTLILCYK